MDYYFVDFLLFFLFFIFINVFFVFSSNFCGFLANVLRVEMGRGSRLKILIIWEVIVFFFLFFFSRSVNCKNALHVRAFVNSILLFF